MTSHQLAQLLLSHPNLPFEFCEDCDNSEPTLQVIKKIDRDHPDYTPWDFGAINMTDSREERNECYRLWLSSQPKKPILNIG